MSRLSNTQRTLRYLEQQGCHSGIVEKFNQFSGPFGRRSDLFGIIDIISIYPFGIAGIQSCGQDFAAHDRKILESEMAVEWIKAGGILELIGWRKLKLHRGGKALRWKPRIRRYEIGDFK